MKKKIPALLLALAMTVSMLATPASAFYVHHVSYVANPVTNSFPPSVLYVEKEGGGYEEIYVYDKNWNQLYIQVGENEWEKLDTPLTPDEIIKMEAAKEAGVQSAAAVKKAEMEKTYHIKFTDGFDQDTAFLSVLEEQIKLIPLALREKVTSQLNKMGKTLKIGDADNVDEYTAGLAGSYSSSKVQIDINPYIIDIVFPHEYGHLIFNTVLPRLYNSTTLKNEWNALKGGEGPTHVSDYAMTSYNEDLAETFNFLMISWDYLRNLAIEYPDCLALKKANFMRDLLCKELMLDKSVFPDLVPSVPSAWAKADIEEYQRVLGGNYEGVVPAPNTAHAAGYQKPATRVQFVYSMLNNLVEKLRSNSFFTGMSYEAYVEKWHPAARYLYIPEEFPFTDMTSVSENSAKAILSMYRNGVINGKSATTFDPQGQITRQEAATILYRLCNALGYKLPKGSLSYDDASKVAPWAQEAVAAVSAAGIMNGVGNNNFDPTGIYTCEQSALCILRAFKLILS